VGPKGFGQLAQKDGVSEVTLYGWKSKCGGMKGWGSATTAGSGGGEPAFEAVGGRSRPGQKKR
jgi:hypothetical protein